MKNTLLISCILFTQFSHAMLVTGVPSIFANDNKREEVPSFDMTRAPTIDGDELNFFLVSSMLEQQGTPIEKSQSLEAWTMFREAWEIELNICKRLRNLVEVALDDINLEKTTNIADFLEIRTMLAPHLTALPAFLRLVESINESEPKRNTNFSGENYYEQEDKKDKILFIKKYKKKNKDFFAKIANHLPMTTRISDCNKRIAEQVIETLESRDIEEIISYLNAFDRKATMLIKSEINALQKECLDGTRGKEVNIVTLDLDQIAEGSKRAFRIKMPGLDAPSVDLGYYFERISLYGPFSGYCGFDCTVVSRTLLGEDQGTIEDNFPLDRYPLIFGNLAATKEVQCKRTSRLVESIFGIAPTPGVLPGHFSQFSKAQVNKQDSFSTVKDHIKWQLNHNSPVIVLTYKGGIPHLEVAVGYSESLDFAVVLDATSGIISLRPFATLESEMDLVESGHLWMADISQVQMLVTCTAGALAPMLWLAGHARLVNANLKNIFDAILEIVNVNSDKNSFGRFTYFTFEQNSQNSDGEKCQ